jgi:hypothetical protein
MYDDAMDAVHTHLIQESSATHLIYTAELIPEQNSRGEMSVFFLLNVHLSVLNLHSSWRRTPKQDHLVCFLGGSLMLGAATAGATVQPVSIPPRSAELTKIGQRDWKTGLELVKTCVATYDTATYVFILYFRCLNLWVERDRG